MQTLDGRVAVVTGAGSGIGQAIAEALAAAGARVLLTDLDGDAAARTADTIRERGSEVDSLPLDVRDPEAVEVASRQVVKRFGALHIAVNNAGMASRHGWRPSSPVARTFSLSSSFRNNQRPSRNQPAWSSAGRMRRTIFTSRQETGVRCWADRSGGSRVPSREEG